MIKEIVKNKGFVDLEIDEKLNLSEEIYKLKKQKNAIILAHYYQLPEIQDIADFIGDSLALAQFAKNTNADIILFAGVHFMAETAKILNPKKKVLIPDLNAGCSLADSAPKEKFELFLEQYPEHKVISYINCSAEVKALSDIICTSGNAEKIVNSFPLNEKLIFAPDRNLGAYINKISGRNMVLYDGACEIHDIIKLENIMDLKKQHPDAKVIAHPECKALILEMADFIGSTAKLLDYTSRSNDKEFIIATESGIVHQMKKDSPDKSFYIVPVSDVCNCNDCPYMKLNTLKKVYLTLLYELPEILMDHDLLNKARIPLERMLQVSI